MTRIRIKGSSSSFNTSSPSSDSTTSRTMGEQKEKGRVYSIFQTSDEVDLKLEELESVFEGEEESKMEKRRSAKQMITGTVGEIGANSRRFYRFVKKHILHRKRDTQVKNINILPEDYHTTWAVRSAGSAASRSSVDSVGSMDSANSGGRNSGLETVHDMENDINNIDDIDDITDKSSIES